MKPSSAEKASAWVPVALYAAFIFTLSSMPVSAPPPFLKFRVDWIFHMLEYSVLGALFARALARTLDLHDGRALVLAALAAGALTGASDEWHQSFVPSRNCDPADVAADSLGAMAGAAVWIRKRGKTDA